MNLQMYNTWFIETSSDEIRLIIKALGGNLSDTEREDARKLGDTITQLRASHARTLVTQMEQHALPSL
jgi:hypothetical protein